jgi:hypothetical protein
MAIASSSPAPPGMPPHKQSQSAQPPEVQQQQQQMQPVQPMPPPGFIPASWLAGQWEFDYPHCGWGHITWMITRQGDDRFAMTYEHAGLFGCCTCSGSAHVHRDENEGLNAFRDRKSGTILRTIDENTCSISGLSVQARKNQTTNQGVARGGPTTTQTMHR